MSCLIMDDAMNGIWVNLSPKEEAASSLAFSTDSIELSKRIN